MSLENYRVYGICIGIGPIPPFLMVLESVKYVIQVPILFVHFKMNFQAPNLNYQVKTQICDCTL